MAAESTATGRNHTRQGTDTGDTAERRTGLRIGSLFSGAGGLDMAVEAVFGGHTVWHAEIDKAASKVLAHRFPGVSNLGSVTDIDWTTVEPVDVLCGGFPCQDVSAAGKRAGIKDGTRSGLWSVFAEAIDQLRPRFVVIENVRGLLSAAAHRNGEDDEQSGDVESGAAVMGDGAGRPVLRAAGAVLGDLADLGYDAQWATVAASDVGAPHRRERVFILASSADSSGVGRAGNVESRQDVVSNRPEPAHIGEERGVVDLLPTPNAQDGNGGGRYSSDGHQKTPPGEARLLPTPRSSDCFGAGQHGDGGMDLRTTVTLLGTPQAHSGGPTQRKRPTGKPNENYLERQVLVESSWGKYAPAIHRWEQLTRPAPAPTEPNKNGNPRLSAAFSEWLMGWPDGWVTDPAIGISRNDQLRIVGNGVCPQQAAQALTFLLNVAAGTHTHTHRERADMTPTLLPTPCSRDHKDGDSAAVHARHTPSLGAVSRYFGNENGAAG